MKTHSWVNYPNSTTRKCTRCKIIKVQTSDGKGNSTVMYHLNNGVISESYIECNENINKFEKLNLKLKT